MSTLLDLFVQEMPCVVWSTDADLRVLAYYGGGIGAVEIPAVERGVTSFTDLFPADHPVIAAHRRVLAGETANYETEFGGRVFHAHVIPVRAPDGRIEQCLGVALDITDRARAERTVERDALFLSHVQDAIIVTDMDGVITYWNDSATRLFGWTAEEMLGRPYVSRFPEKARAFVLEQMALRRGGVDWDGEFQDYRKDGSRVWTDARARRITDSAGVPIGVLGISHDISERKRRQAENARQLVLAEFVRGISLAVVRAGTLDDMLNACAQATIEHLGAVSARFWIVDEASQTLLLRGKAGVTRPSDVEDVRIPVGRHKVGRIARDRQPYLTNDVVSDPLLRDREWAKREGMVAFAGHPLIVNDRLVGVMTMFARQPLDVATLDALATVTYSIAGAIRRKQNEQAVSMLAAIVESSNDAIVGTSSERVITSWNRGAEALYGYTASEAIGQTVRIFLADPDDVSQQDAAFDRLLRGERVPPLEVVRRRKDGTTVEIALTLSAIRDETGRVVGTSGISRDISERKQLEEQFRQAQKMEAVGRLAGGVAHDFNNLLTIINGYSEVLTEAPDTSDAAARDMLQEIRRAGQRAAALTQQLLAYSRKQMLHLELLDVGAIVAEARKMLQRLIGEDVELTVSVGPDLRAVKADAGQLTQVLMNLCVNARDAMPTGGRIHIAVANGSRPSDAPPDAAQPHDFIMLSVTDTGCGMDAATQANIFEPFFTTKPKGEGTGLGLATVYGIVRQLGGHIRVESRVGHGATFRIYLPATDEQELDAAQTADIVPGTETILLVEDEPGVRALTRLMLSRAGYTVIAARDGRDALQLATAHEGRIDLLITDVVMPHMSGRQIADMLRVTQPGLRVLFMSGYTDDAVVRHGVRESQMPFVQKPFTGKDLTAKVREVLDTPPGSGTTAERGA